MEFELQSQDYFQRELCDNELLPVKKEYYSDSSCVNATSAVEFEHQSEGDFKRELLESEFLPVKEEDFSDCSSVNAITAEECACNLIFKVDTVTEPQTEVQQTETAPVSLLQEDILQCTRITTVRVSSFSPPSVFDFNSVYAQVQAVINSTNASGHRRIPRISVRGRLDTQQAKALIIFLESYATFSCSRYTRCFSCSFAGGSVLTCEECSLKITGLHNRYLKIFLHYKSAHKNKCNKLISLKCLKHQGILSSMIRAWQLDMQDLLDSNSFISIVNSKITGEDTANRF